MFETEFIFSLCVISLLPSQYLYDMECDIHETTATLRRTPLHFAVLRHKMACFHKLLAFGANPDPRDTFGNSVCHYAAEDGATDILDVLVRHDIDLDAQDITRKTPLMKATRNGKINTVKRLLAAGCSLNIRDKNGDTALHFSARQGRVELVGALVDAGSDVNMQNQWGHAPLMEAVCYNNKDAASRLLVAECDVNLREYKGGDTALHVSVRKNYTTITERLLQTDHVQQVYNYQGELALYDAVVNQKMDAIKLFLLYNYDLCTPIKLEYDGTGGKTLIRVALERGHFELMRMLALVGYVISCQPPSTAARHLATTASVSNDHVTTVQRFLSGVHGARTLKQMSRLSIRQQVGFGIHRKCATLPLPRTLRDYILLTNII